MRFLSAWICVLAFALLGVEALLDDFYCDDREVNRNCYDVLGVQHSSKPKEIKKAYRALAKKLHPDVRNQEKNLEKRKLMEDKYLLLNKAYQILNNLETRKEYDNTVADKFRYNVMKRKYYGGGQNVYIHPLVVVVIILVVGSVLQRYLREKMMESEYRRCVYQVVNNKKWLAATAAIIADNGCDEEMAKLKERDEAAWAKKALALNPVEMELHVKPVLTDEIFAIQVMKLPYTSVMFLLALMSSFGKTQKLTRQDKIKKTASALGISEAELINRTDSRYVSEKEKLGSIDDLLKRKLWKPKNIAKMREEAMTKQLANVPKHRRNLVRKELEAADHDVREQAYRDQFKNTFGAQ